MEKVALYNMNQEHNTQVSCNSHTALSPLQSVNGNVPAKHERNIAILVKSLTKGYIRPPSPRKRQLQHSPESYYNARSNGIRISNKTEPPELFLHVCSEDYGLV
jgi:hypothetical protein